MATHHLTISGMTCNSCAGLIDDEISELQGVESTSTSLETSTTTVVADEAVSTQDLLDAVTRAGYSATATHSTS